MQVFRHVVFGLLKDLALFASAAVSVAGAKGKRTSSATLLNQLMSFAAVAGITMSGAMQAPIFQHDMEKSTQEVLALWEEVLSYLCLPVAFAQGQTPGEAGASWEAGTALDEVCASSGCDRSAYLEALDCSQRSSVHTSWPLFGQ
ncbi:unnamed protein product [Symbiodinium sp. CCMP2456]|nr:unnamed protein product [Symbiodinium sp. CCMP2456]